MIKEPGVIVTDRGDTYDFRHLDKDLEFQKFLNIGPPPTQEENVDVEKAKEGARLFFEKFLCK